MAPPIRDGVKRCSLPSNAKEKDWGSRLLRCNREPAPITWWKYTAEYCGGNRVLVPGGLASDRPKRDESLYPPNNFCLKTIDIEWT